MNNDDVWVVLSIQQTLGRPFCEQLSDHNWRGFVLLTSHTLCISSSTGAREIGSKDSSVIRNSGIQNLRVESQNLRVEILFLITCSSEYGVHPRDGVFFGDMKAVFTLYFKFPIEVSR